MLHQLLSHPLNSGRQEVLSLEEILAEGSSQHTGERRGNRLQVRWRPVLGRRLVVALNAHIKCTQQSDVTLIIVTCG